MISEEQQDQAALYALDLLGEAEAAAFERECAADAELQTLVRSLRDTAGAMALSRPPKAEPPAALKERIMSQLSAFPAPAVSDKIITPAPSAFRWIPWAIAAALLLFSGFLAVDRNRMREKFARELAERPTLVALAPSDDGPQKAKALVAWNNERQAGTIKIENLPAAARGKDYQLWAVDAEHTDPISAGIVRTAADDVVQIEFKPSEVAHKVKAFAISLEREGGAPKKEGPILLVGKI